MNLDITEKWAKEIALMSDAEFEENCKHIETLLSRRKQALRIHDVSGLLPTDYELEGWLMLDCGGSSPESKQIRDDMRRGAKWMRRMVIERIKGNIR